MKLAWNMEFGIRFIPYNPNTFPNPNHRNPQNRIPSCEVQANHTLIILIVIQFLALHLLLLESFSENKFSCHFFFFFCTFSMFYNFDILDLAIICIILSRQWTTKVLIRLCGCAGWSAPLLFAYGIGQIFSWSGSYFLWNDSTCELQYLIHLS